MSKKNEVVIIGAGVIGCSIAYHLAKKGITSVIIEKESIGCRALISGQYPKISSTSKICDTSVAFFLGIRRILYHPRR